MSALTKPQDLNPTRPSLLERVKNWDDQESWKVFFDAYSKLVYSVAFKAGLNGVEAEDAMQETMLSIAKNIREFHYNPAIGKFRSWLIRNTMWRVDEQIKKRKKPGQPASVADTEEHDAAIEQIADPSAETIAKMCEEEWANHLFQLALEKVKKEVNPKHYNVYELYVLQQMPTAKVAELCGIEEGNVYIIKNRIGKRVQEELEILMKQAI